MVPWLIVALVLVIAVTLLAKRGPSPHALARAAAASQDLSALLQAAATLRPDRRPAFLHAAVLTLWNGWQRPLAARLVREFASQHPDQRLVQYWLGRMLQIEPELAGQTFDEAFLAGVYRPEVAEGCCQASS